jgi:hypothetical protein
LVLPGDSVEESSEPSQAVIQCSEIFKLARGSDCEVFGEAMTKILELFNRSGEFTVRALEGIWMSDDSIKIICGGSPFDRSMKVASKGKPGREISFVALREGTRHRLRRKINPEGRTSQAI